MNGNPSTVLCNAGPLMALGKLNRLDLLAKLYGEVLIPRAVYDEVVVRGLAHGFNDALTVQLFWNQHEWPIEDASESVLAGFRPSKILGVGETQVLALAKTLPEPLVLLDDELARTEAHRMNLRVKGTLGILADSHRQDHLPFDELELLVQEINARPDIWIGDRLCQSVLDALRTESSHDDMDSGL
ncbi:MAG: hypothetical protein GY856_19305 [bacterium]|nr:hypothetical protein [bacterium]